MSTCLLCEEDNRQFSDTSARPQHREAWRVHLRQVEFKVELPRRGAGRIVSVLVHERKPELDDLQEVDVTP